MKAGLHQEHADSLLESPRRGGAAPSTGGPGGGRAMAMLGLAAEVGATRVGEGVLVPEAHERSPGGGVRG